MTPGWFAQGQPDQKSQNDSRDADHHEGRPPAVELGHPATDEKAGQPAQGKHGTEHGQGGTALFRRIVIGNQGLRRRAAAGLADPHTDPGQEQ